MGYTHYIDQKSELPLDKFKLFADECETIIQHSNIPVQFDWDDSNPHQITQEIVRFNGVNDDGHETFCLDRIFKPLYRDEISNGFYFSLCKTEKKPYDKVVVACLYAAKWHFKEDIQLSSDGNKQDRLIGYKLFIRATNKTSILWDCDE